jgi:hypothetical protein
VDFRRTVACLIVVLGVLFAGFVAGSPDYNGDCGNPKSAEQTLVTSSSQAPNTPTHNANKADCHSPKWYAALKRPEWLGIIVGTITFIFIGWQSWATKESADAAKRSIELQEVALCQWVAIKNWRGIPNFQGDNKTFHIEFDVTNPTRLPLTFNGALIKIDGQATERIGTNAIPPDHENTIAVSVMLTDEQIVKWQGAEGQKLVLPLNGFVVFQDALEKTRMQPVTGLLVCSQMRGIELVNFHGGGLYLSKNDEEKGQNPN